MLGAVFNATGNSPPMNVAAKGAYMTKDLNSWAEYYGAPFNFPKFFPIKTIGALRMTLAAEEEGAAAPFSFEVFKAYWADGKNIAEEAVLAEVAKSVGLDADKMLARIKEQDIKDRLKDNTDEAVSRGAFGAPTFYIGEQMFWGNDRLVLVEEAIKKL